VFRIKLRALPSLSEPTGRKNRLPPRKQNALLFFFAKTKTTPRLTVALSSFPTKTHSQGEKKSFGEWLLEKSCRDSGAIGAGYEGELKDGRFKGKKK
jgi:hypothetical protein